MDYDLFSIRNSFEKETGLKYDDYLGFERVWRRTPTYRGHGYVGPDDMAFIARSIIQESGIRNADDAILTFYFFVVDNTEKYVTPKRDGPYGPIILSDEDFLDSYALRTYVKGKGICGHMAAEILGLSKGVGIPSKFSKYNRTHGYVDAWTDTSGWIHIGYNEGILAEHDSNILDKYLKRLISASKKKGYDISDLMRCVSSNMKKYGYNVPDSFVDDWLKTSGCCVSAIDVI